MASPIPLPPDIPESFNPVANVEEIGPKDVLPRFPEDVAILEKKVDKLEEPSTAAVVTTEPKLQTTTKLKDDNLEDLHAVDRVMVYRKLDVKGVIFLKGKKNTFHVRRADHHLVYTIEEENNWWVSYFCYGLRPLVLRVLNGAGEEVLKIKRPYNCTTRMLPCQLQRLQVFSPDNKLVGSIEQQWAALRPVYVIRDSNGNRIFDVRGPVVTWSCFQDVYFHIKRPNGAVIATTSKRWQGVIHALFFAPVTDKFNLIYYDKTLTGEEKSLVLALSLLFDYMYYDV